MQNPFALSTIIKNAEAEAVKLYADELAVIQAEEAKLAPTIAKIDPAQVNALLQTLSGGKINATEAQLAETSFALILQALSSVATKATAAKK